MTPAMAISCSAAAAATGGGYRSHDRWALSVRRASASASALFHHLLLPLTKFPPAPTRNLLQGCCCLSSSSSPSSSSHPTKRAPKTVVQRERSEEELADFVVVNFYKLVAVRDPHAEVAKHLAFLQGRDIHGRIYINEQGINAQYSGPNEDASAYADWLKQDERFSDILVQSSPSPDGHAFPRLKLRYKPSLVQLEGGVAHLPLLDPAMRATPLTPSEWKERLQSINNVGAPTDTTDASSSNRKVLLLDVRNGYEWDIGHFQGAQRPSVDCFRSTSFGLSEQEVASSDPLAGIDKDNTDILMYCTGGIRCDVYSPILRQKGFQNLYSLSGGISNYLKSEGSTEWTGNLFVFDSRLAVQPSIYNPEVKDNQRPSLLLGHSTFSRCYVCGSELIEFRHRNCANLDCNRLFLSCHSCVNQLQGCCCSDCTQGPRLRPVLHGHQRYEKWHLYRDADELQRSA